nr:hypothetical protein [Neorhizobium tomejilense]
MSWQDITKEFYEEFGEYHVCAWWNGESGGRHEARFITDRKPPLKEYSLVTPWPDGARFFVSAEDAQACLDTEAVLRPGLFDGWRVLKLADLEAEFGHASHPAIALVGGEKPEHPQTPVVVGPNPAVGIVPRM